MSWKPNLSWTKEDINKNPYLTEDEKINFIKMSLDLSPTDWILKAIHQDSLAKYFLRHIAMYKGYIRTDYPYEEFLNDTYGDYLQHTINQYVNQKEPISVLADKARDRVYTINSTPEFIFIALNKFIDDVLKKEQDYKNIRVDKMVFDPNKKICRYMINMGFIDLIHIDITPTHPDKSLLEIDIYDEDDITLARQALYISEGINNYFRQIYAIEDLSDDKHEPSFNANKHTANIELAHLLPKKAQTLNDYKRAWQVWKEMVNEYSYEELDGRRTSRKPTNKDWSDRLIYEYSYSRGEKTLTNIKTLGKAGMLD